MSTTPPASEILLVDSDRSRGESLVALISKQYRCRLVEEPLEVSGAPDASVILAAERDTGKLLASFRALKTFRNASSIGIISTTQNDPQMVPLFSAGARLFLTGAGARRERDLKWQLHAFANGATEQNLESIFGPLNEHCSMVVRDRWERQAAAERAMEFFTDAEFPDSIVDIQLALDELLNNALYHSFRDDDGHEKYTAETFDALDSNEALHLDIARDADFHIVRVSDTAGTLAPEHVTQNLARHMTMQGLLDEHGRGFFLMRSVSDGMLIRIQPGVRSSITMVFGRHSNALVKGLLIQ